MTTLQAASGTFIMVEGNAETGGHMSCEEVQELTAAPRGWSDGLALGAFPDAVRRCGG